MLSLIETAGGIDQKAKRKPRVPVPSLVIRPRAKLPSRTSVIPRRFLAIDGDADERRRRRTGDGLVEHALSRLSVGVSRHRKIFDATRCKTTRRKMLASLKGEFVGSTAKRLSRELRGTYCGGKTFSVINDSTYLENI